MKGGILFDGLTFEESKEYFRLSNRIFKRKNERLEQLENKIKVYRQNFIDKIQKSNPEIFKISEVLI